MPSCGAQIAGRPRQAHGDLLDREPAKTLPNVPTVAQAGSPELTFDGLVGIYGPRDMPLELRERIAADVEDGACRSCASSSRLVASGQEVIPGSAAEFAAVDRSAAQVGG